MLGKPGDVMKLDFERGIYSIAHPYFDSFSGCLGIIRQDDMLIIVLSRQSSWAALTYVMTSREVGWIRSSADANIDLTVHSPTPFGIVDSEVIE